MFISGMHLLISTSRIASILASVGGAVILGLLVFMVWGYNKLWQPRYRRGIEQRNAGLRGWSAIRKAQEQKFADLEAQNQRARAQTKKDSVRPDVFFSMVDASTPEYVIYWACLYST
jgi:type II secretory pathway component PulM